jgi:hypothetical protein
MVCNYRCSGLDHSSPPESELKFTRPSIGKLVGECFGAGLAEYRYVNSSVKYNYFVKNQADLVFEEWNCTLYPRSSRMFRFTGGPGSGPSAATGC